MSPLIPSPSPHIVDDAYGDPESLDLELEPEEITPAEKAATRKRRKAELACSSHQNYVALYPLDGKGTPRGYTADYRAFETWLDTWLKDNPIDAPLKFMNGDRLQDTSGPLNSAVYHGNLGAVDRLLAKGAGRTREARDSALSTAVFNQDEGMVARLLEAGFEVDGPSGGKLVLRTIDYSHGRSAYQHQPPPPPGQPMVILDLLIKAGAPLPPGALHLAAERGELDAVKLLLAAGAEVNAVHAGSLAIDHVVDQGFAQHVCRPNRGYPGILTELIRAGSEIERVEIQETPSFRNELTPLQKAASTGSTWAMEALLEAGADPHGTGIFHGKRKSLDKLFKSGMRAAQNSRTGDLYELRCMELRLDQILRAGATVEAPIFAAVRASKLADVQLLVDFGADIYAVDAEGRGLLELVGDNERLSRYLQEIGLSPAGGGLSL